MNKKKLFIFLSITLFVFSNMHAQTNPYYTVTQKNVKPLANSNFAVVTNVSAVTILDGDLVLDTLKRYDVTGVIHIAGFKYADRKSVV